VCAYSLDHITPNSRGNDRLTCNTPAGLHRTDATRHYCSQYRRIDTAAAPVLP